MDCLVIPRRSGSGPWGHEVIRPARRSTTRVGRFDPMARDLSHLYKGVVDGDREAFEELYGNLKDLVWWAIRNAGVTGSDAEDVYQTTWAKFFEYLGRHRDPNALKGWLVTVARNECIATGRMSGRILPMEEALEIEAVSVPPDEEALHAVDVEALDRVLAELSERERQLVALWAHGATYEEMDKAIGIPAGSVGPTMARCREKLAKLMKEKKQ